MSLYSRLTRLWGNPREVNPTENLPEGWKRKQQRRNKRLKKQK